MSRDVVGTLTQLGQIAGLLFIMWGSGDSFRSFGIVRDKWLKLAAVSAGLLIVDQAMNLAILHRLPHLSIGAFADHGYTRSISSIVFIAVASSSEELLFRAWLITRFEELLGDYKLAVVVSVLTFSSIHIFRGGVTGFIIAGAGGLIYALTFAKFRSIAPVAIVHSVHNILLNLSLWSAGIP